MERHSRTPLIDGGVVNAPPNTTAKHDFAENPQQGSSGTGIATSGLDNGQTASAEQPYMARDHSTGLTADTRTTGSKLKESASGAKGLAAAIHGTGEILRGNINAAVDRAVKDVCFYFIYPLRECHSPADLGGRYGTTYQRHQ